MVGKAQEKTAVLRTVKRRNATSGKTYAWLSRSTAVAAEANCSGSCSDVTRTATPRRSRSVQAAQYASSSSGASSGASPMVCSSTQPASNPSSSARARKERRPGPSKPS